MCNVENGRAHSGSLSYDDLIIGVWQQQMNGLQKFARMRQVCAKYDIKLNEMHENATMFTITDRFV